MLWVSGPIEVAADRDGESIAIRDNCDPKDPAWAPECAAPVAPATDPYEVAPGEHLRLKAKEEGIQRFQCCIHPWMRATVRVTPDDHHKH